MNIRWLKGIAFTSVLWAFACGSSTTATPEHVASTSTRLETGCTSNGDCSPPETCIDGICGSVCVPSSNPCDGYNCGTFNDGCKDVRCGCRGGLVCSGSACVANCANYPNQDDCHDGCGAPTNEGGSCSHYGQTGRCQVGNCFVDCHSFPNEDDCRDGCGNPINDYGECTYSPLSEPGRCIFGSCVSGT